jgi:flavin-dependent dehydrogenase
VSTYDAIVVGARCAGSPTAMLLTHEGYEVLLVERHSPATRSPHTWSTRPGWRPCGDGALLDEVLATGCPPIETYAFDFGPFTIAATAGAAYGPRRTVLDEVLVRAAAAAGPELRERFTVTDLLVEDGRVSGVRGHGQGGRPVTERARMVIGADGLRSLVAREVRPEQYRSKPRLLCGYYAYWSGLPMDGRFEAYIRPDRAFAAWPTNHDLTLLAGGWPYRELEANRTSTFCRCTSSRPSSRRSSRRHRSWSGCWWPCRATSRRWTGSRG